MNELRVADAITEIFALFKRCNKYIDETMPWALAKDEAKTGSSGNRSLQSGREHHASAAALLELLHAGDFREDPGSAERQKRELSEMHTFGLYESGNKVTEQPEILFARHGSSKRLWKR